MYDLVLSILFLGLLRGLRVDSLFIKGASTYAPLSLGNSTGISSINICQSLKLIYAWLLPRQFRQSPPHPRGMRQRTAETPCNRQIGEYFLPRRLKESIGTWARHWGSHHKKEIALWSHPGLAPTVPEQRFLSSQACRSLQTIHSHGWRRPCIVRHAF
ncbi:hypothetical protein ES703_105607 [subsurface metagenome]